MTTAYRHSLLEALLALDDLLRISGSELELAPHQQSTILDIYMRTYAQRTAACIYGLLDDDKHERKGQRGASAERTTDASPKTKPNPSAIDRRTIEPVMPRSLQPAMAAYLLSRRKAALAPGAKPAERAEDVALESVDEKNVVVEREPEDAFSRHVDDERIETEAETRDRTSSPAHRRLRP